MAVVEKKVLVLGPGKLSWVVLEHAAARARARRAVWRRGQCGRRVGENVQKNPDCWLSVGREEKEAAEVEAVMGVGEA